MRTSCLWLGLVGCVLLLSGCWQSELAGYRPPKQKDPWTPPTPVNAPPAPTETASRVDSLGRQLLAANPQLGFRPLFSAIGTDQVTVFHQGTSQVFVSDGLVKRCKSDGEIVAILALELGKMVAERESQIAKEPLEDEPPFVPNLPSDSVGGGIGPDLTRQAELARFERDRPRRKNTPPPPPPNPEVLAKGYLTKAGYKEEELSKVSNILRIAEMTPSFERQMGAPAGQSGLGITNKEK